MKNSAIMLLGLLVLAGCSNLTLTTNISPEEALKTSKVEEYSMAEIGRYKADSLGKVSTSMCRTRSTQPKPTESLLVGNLKYKAQKLGANGIVVMECVDHKINNDCPEFLRCDALAYRVDFDAL
ncbi:MULTISPECIES: hypothetical protein [Shewanella]|uniref:hypothetical protein n=1 Tax=Shewanella TaxID=22 RepID=UPI001181C9B2|nr:MULTISPECIES: hypothetical protein [Shewanella]QYJ90533.1 hypothetical protein K0H81_02720 [Shewanella halotolerans]QYJ94315.1 hypothetical protein K0I31_02660 [Shewanella spartinae]QYK13441.1 hypothetical protein K0I63_02665 [Shewanella rhizosphaerae]TVP15639.1 hypothetical protein AYI87_03975 [Shewanella sp. KCT]